MPVTPTSNLATPLEAARVMLCNSSTWQTVVDAANSTEARDNTHLIGFPLPDPDGDTVDSNTIADYRPFAIITPPEGEAMRFTRNALGAGGQLDYVTAGAMLITIEIDVASGQDDQISDPTLTFLNQIGDILTEFCNNANQTIDTTGTLYLKNVVLLNVARSAPQQRETEGDFHEAIVRVDWGLG